MATNVSLLTQWFAPAAPLDQQQRFDHLFTRLYPPLVNLTYRLVGNRGDAEDTVQDAFIRLSRHPVLGRPDEEIAAWMRRVCLNLGSNRLRSHRRDTRRLEVVGRLDSRASELTDSPVLVTQRHEEQAGVRSVLGDLQQRERDCLVLRHSGCSYAEIGAVLRVSTASVGTVLARAERAFKERYLARYSLEGEVQ